MSKIEFPLGNIENDTNHFIFVVAEMVDVNSKLRYSGFLAFRVVWPECPILVVFGDKVKAQSSPVFVHPSNSIHIL